jgi:hypothetical protein
MAAIVMVQAVEIMLSGFLLCYEQTLAFSGSRISR